MKRVSSFLFRSAVTALLVIGLVGPILTGCATTTSGPTVPGKIVSDFLGKNVLMNDPGVLNLYATTDCNTSAADELRFTKIVCTGGIASLAGPALIPANVQSAIQIGCQTLGYTDAQNQLLPSVPASVLPGPVNACLNPPTPASLKLPPLKSDV